MCYDNDDDKIKFAVWVKLFPSSDDLMETFSSCFLFNDPTATVDDLKQKLYHLLGSTYLKGRTDIFFYLNTDSLNAHDALETSDILYNIPNDRYMPLIAIPLSIYQTYPCRISFFNEFKQNTKKQGNWLIFSKTLPFVDLDRIYIRKSYEVIASSIITSDNKNSLVTGTSGIGKSIFLFYLLWELLQRNQRVLLIYEQYTLVFDQGGMAVYDCDAALPSRSDHSFWNSQLWCLFDSHEKDLSDLKQIPKSQCKFVLSTCPEKNLLVDYKKKKHVVYYMPIWTKEELTSISQIFSCVNDWEERYEILGGIPRFVFEDTDQTALTRIRIFCRQFNMNDCISIVDMNSFNARISEGIHCLVHLHSKEPYRSCRADFPSQIVMDLMVQNYGAQVKRIMNEFFSGLHQDGIAKSLCESIFESHCLELLEKGGDFPCCTLSQDSKPEEFILSIPPSTRIVCEKIESNQKCHQLFVSRKKPCNFMNAWILGIGAFRFVTSETDVSVNSIKIKEELNKLGRSSNRIYWVLSPRHLDALKINIVADIDQFVVCVPYPTYIIVEDLPN